MPNQIDTRRMIPVEPDTHQELKELSAEEELKFPDLIRKLLNFYKANN